MLDPYQANAAGTPDLAVLTRRVTWTVRANAIASVAIGLMSLLWPGPTLVVAVVLLGLWLITQGFALVVEGWATARGGRLPRALRIAAGLLLIAAGLLTVWHPGASLPIIVGLVGAGLIVAGAIEVIAAVVERRVRRGLHAALGAVAVCAGAVVLAWPRITVEVLTAIAGIALVFIGIAQYVLTRNAAAALRELA